MSKTDGLNRGRNLKRCRSSAPRPLNNVRDFADLRRKNPLDSTSVHPESYKIAEKLLEGFGFGKKELSGEKPGSLEKLVKTRGAENLAEELSVGVPTLNDIVAELSKPEETRETSSRSAAAYRRP